jgi:orotidine-5'-phosphate decarboxylase
MIELVRIKKIRAKRSKEEAMIRQLIDKIQKTKAPICVGLDPMLSYIPEHVMKKAFEEFGETLEGAAEAIWLFNKEIVDHVYDLIPSVKPQIAMYEQFGIEGLKAYTKTVNYCQEKGLFVIGDAKRGDIGSTSAAYATAHIGQVKVGNKSFSAFGTDFLTVNPYLGTDGVKPFVDVCKEEDKGLFILVKTSNPSSGEFQDQLINGRPLYELVADKVVEWGADCMDGAYSNVGAVVGATYPEMSRILRKLMPNTYFLVPGYGAQGGTAEDLKPCFNEDGLGAIVNSSRGIIAAYKSEKYARYGGEHFGEASRQAVIDMVTDINRVL